MYVLRSPPLIQAAFRHKDLSFDPLIIDSLDNILLGSDYAKQLIRQEPTKEGERTYLGDTHRIMSETLIPGPSLVKMNARVLDSLARLVNPLGTEWEKKRLFGWLRDVFTIASSNSLYGKHNPITKDLSLIDAVWYAYNASFPPNRVLMSSGHLMKAKLSLRPISFLG
jgi:hypothetical protein